MNKNNRYVKDLNDELFHYKVYFLLKKYISVVLVTAFKFISIGFLLMAKIKRE